jgi:hypothetical protein
LLVRRSDSGLFRGAPRPRESAALRIASPLAGPR